MPHATVHEVNAKQTSEESAEEMVSLSVRVRRETADLLREVAEANYRPVAAEMRRLIEERVALHLEQEKAA